MIQSDDMDGEKEKGQAAAKRSNEDTMCLQAHRYKWNGRDTSPHSRELQGSRGLKRDKQRREHFRGLEDIGDLVMTKFQRAQRRDFRSWGTVEEGQRRAVRPYKDENSGVRW